METDILLPDDVGGKRQFLGQKTLNLRKCLDLGFDVPRFVALPSLISQRLRDDSLFREKTAAGSALILQCGRYAVRSSALIEDGADSSFAGQFTTKLDVPSNKLSEGIATVLEQAHEFLNGDLASFSIIIQEYIAPDISGVAFTRNPNGAREMVIEYGFGAGEKIVGGSTRPKRTSFYWNETGADLPRQFPRLQIENFKRLEESFGTPQDIEWCIRGSRFYVLQTRPVTTISERQYDQARYLDERLPKEGAYFLAKTEIPEIAPRPTDFTMSLLKSIYADNGPVRGVYGKYGVQYKDTDFLRIIGNELYVDKEKEIRGLLPAFSYLGNRDFSPRFRFFSKSFPTVRNMYFLNTITTGRHEQIFDQLKARLISSTPDTDFKAAFDGFSADYSLTFECNLLSGLAVKKAEAALKNQPVTLAEIMQGGGLFTDLRAYALPLPSDVQGNTLEISDESVFVANADVESRPDERVKQWWDDIAGYRRTMLQGRIAEAIIYTRLRELGRWLTVKNISAMRRSLLRAAEGAAFSEVRDVYLATVSEVLDGQLSEPACRRRKDDHQRYDGFSLPSRITSSFIEKDVAVDGISAGVASGVLRNREYLDSRPEETQKIILYTDVLSPDLAGYFDRVAGIVSENGGLLSHLAIMAREKNIPVVVGASLAKGAFALGDHVRIDGSSGVIEKTKAE